MNHAFTGHYVSEGTKARYSFTALYDVKETVDAQTRGAGRDVVC